MAGSVVSNSSSAHDQKQASSPKRSGWIKRVHPVGRIVGGLAALAPGVAASLLAYLFTRPIRSKLPEQERKWLLASAARPLTLRKSGETIPLYEWQALPRGLGVVDEAPKPTVLLVHGFSGRASQLGAFAEPLTQLGYRVVGFDAPGHGAAPGTRSSLPEMRDVLCEVAGHLGPLDAIVAHSNGAAAVVSALSQKMQARRVVLIAPPTDLRRYLQAVAAKIGFGKNTVLKAQEKIEARLSVPFSDLAAVPLARQLTQPALIVHDRVDRVVPFEEGEALAEAWPGAELIETSGQGHTRLLRDPKTTRQVVAFLARGGAWES